jgi:hypothetical protein
VAGGDNQRCEASQQRDYDRMPAIFPKLALSLERQAWRFNCDHYDSLVVVKFF